MKSLPVQGLHCRLAAVGAADCTASDGAGAPGKWRHETDRVGAGAVSTLPTFNGKGLRVPGQAILPLLALFALLSALLLIHPWKIYLGVALLYIASFPVSVWVFLKRKKIHGNDPV